ncbi:MAG: response regulator [Chloroflexi bacterium SZAS-1]|jgi:DNA-binding response OmpR family regulator|nr:response regulator [Chloroflexi bacterium SZAS-1]HNP85268.1 response regulator [Kouleothrix sp.]
MKILLAEDELDIQYVTQVALEDAGHQVVTANDGVVALARARAEPFDVVLLDVMMPNLDGLAVCKQIKADPQIRTLPVIFLSARSQQFEVEAGMRLGALGYIIKPFDMFGLSREISVLLAHAKPS